jgi:hypothetical protein
MEASAGAQEYLRRHHLIGPNWQTARRVLIVANTHGKVVCKCGNVLARCRCIEHSNTILRTVEECEVCRPKNLKDRLQIEEK